MLEITLHQEHLQHGVTALGRKGRPDSVAGGSWVGSSGEAGTGAEDTGEEVS